MCPFAGQYDKWQTEKEITVMTEYSKFNVIYRLQKWMDSVPGQTFLNYAYSWGASVVILGTLFKLTHLPGANTMLFIGMGTEVFVFFLSAFDRPFDKTANGRDLPTHVTEEYLEGKEQPAEEAPDATVAVRGAKAAGAAGAATTATGKGAAGAPVGGVIYFQGGSYESHDKGKTEPQQAQGVSEGQPVQVGEAETAQAIPAGQPAQEGAGVQPNFVPQMSVEEAQALNEAQGSYVEELKKLVETLGKVNEQSMRLTRDSEEMENLNRTLTGISKIYEMQLKGASQQVGTIDQINDQTRKMAQQIEQLNKIYARMIEAMTVNMRVAQPGVNPSQGNQAPTTNY
jgi:gliding motility-associated protein GldL